MAEEARSDAAGSGPDLVAAAVARRAREMRREVSDIGAPHDRYERILRGILLEAKQRRDQDGQEEK